MNYYNIPATTSFADRLAQYCDDLAQTENIPLSAIKIFLPTRRGIRTLQDAFLQRSGGKPRILPIMQSIGDADLEEASFADPNALNIPPAIDSMHRQIILARLLEHAWPHDYNYLQAMSIASDLGTLIDQIHTEELDINTLNDIMSVKELSHYWEITTSFLSKLLGDIWPKYLANKGMIDPGQHRKMRIHALTQFYQNNPSENPVIIAGSTGSIPSTRSFIRTIGNMPCGHVILPALDHLMDEKAWFEIPQGHPQYLLKNLLSFCDVERQDIKCLSDDNSNRLFLNSEIMRPAITTEQWQNLSLPDCRNKIENGLNGIMMCEADNDHHKSIIIALAMVEIAADPDQIKTATLITPNRYLAMRVQANLKQWGIDIDDSGGTSLTNTPIGQFTLSIIESYRDNQIHPVPFLATLKNTCMGNKIRNIRTNVRIMEKDIFRGVRPHGDFNKLIDLAKNSADFISSIKHEFEPFEQFQNGRHDVLDITKAHIEVMENLATSQEEDGATRLWRGDDGETLSDMFKSILEYAHNMPRMSLYDYGQFLQSILSKQNFTARYGKHPRLSILGQIESRMIKADRVILSGLNEGVWPPESGFDAWMSRPMRSHFGLPSLEQKTTLAAHDFACGFCAPEVMITRSKKSDGQPTLRSRWLERLETVLQAAQIDPSLWPQTRGKYYASLAQMVRQSEHKQSITRPMPSPPLSKRPTEFSVTEIEKWMRDPYWIYAKKILNMRKWDDVDMDVSVADRGTIIHDAIEQFTTMHNDDFIPDNAYQDLIKIGENVFEKQAPNPEIHGLWWPRFTKTAKWFIDHERDWRKGTYNIHSEIKGTINLSLAGVTFTLSGKADRIEQRKDQSITIIDYKTGSAPQTGDVNTGLSSQLTLEALIVEQDGFDNISPSKNDYLLNYWCLNGSGDGGHVSVAQGTKKGTAKPTQTLMAEAYTGVQNLMTAFHNDNTPYIGSPDTTRMIKTEYNDYAHLQRISEWMVEGDEGDDI